MLALAFATAPAAAVAQDASAPADPDRGQAMVSPGIREGLREEFRRIEPISTYLAAVTAPARRVTAEAAGLRPSQLGEPRLLVVGSLPDAELRRLLAVHAIREPLSKVVGDGKYARLYFGDPAKDPCCFGEWTYSKESGEWRRIFVYSRSH